MCYQIWCNGDYHTLSTVHLTACLAAEGYNQCSRTATIHKVLAGGASTWVWYLKVYIIEQEFIKVVHVYRVPCSRHCG